MKVSTRIYLGFFALGLCLVLAFFWKVFVYYRGIKDGSITASDVSYRKTTTDKQDLARLARAAPGSGLLATTDDPSLGPADAKVTIVEFADFGCPYSQEEAPVIRALAKLYPNDVRLIYRDFPIDSLHPGATLAAKAGECAAEQGKFWDMHDALFKQSSFSKDSVTSLAVTLGLKSEPFKACLAGTFYDKEIAGDQSDGVNSGVVGTPTFFVNGLKIDGDIPYATLKNLIDSFLAQ